MKNNTKILSLPNFESQQAWKVTIIDQIFFLIAFVLFLLLNIPGYVDHDHNLKR